MTKTIKSLVSVFIVAILVSVVGFLSSAYDQLRSERLSVAVTTTHLENILREIGGEKVEVVAIVPGGMCPGHFDIKPDDVKVLHQADCLLSHGWEKWLPGLMKAVENKKLVSKIINVAGSWMVPEINIRAAKEIAETLAELDSENKPFYQGNLRRYRRSIESEVVGIRKNVHGLRDKKAVCSEHQAALLGWLGIKVVHTYGRSEDMSLRELAEAVGKAKKEGVKLVVDNLQSGPEAGRRIAEEIGARHIVLSNFPLNGSYIETLRENVEKVLIAALSSPRVSDPKDSP